MNVDLAASLRPLGVPADLKSADMPGLFLQSYRNFAGWESSISLRVSLAHSATHLSTASVMS